jgi:hypothetical protein
LSSLLGDNAMQVISAFLIFVLGYFTLLISIIVCFVIGRFICQGATRVRGHMAKSVTSEAFDMPASRVESDVTSGFGSGVRGFATTALLPQRTATRSACAEPFTRRQDGILRSATDG